MSNQDSAVTLAAALARLRVAFYETPRTSHVVMVGDDDLGAMLDHVDAMAQAHDAVGAWLSAALEDPDSCDEFKADVNRWFALVQGVRL